MMSDDIALQKRKSGGLPLQKNSSSSVWIGERPSAQDPFSDIEARLEIARNRYYFSQFRTVETLVSDILVEIKSRLEVKTLNETATAKWQLLYASGLTLLGRCQEAVGESSKARETFLGAIKRFEKWLELGNGRFYWNYGILLYKLERFEEAVAAFHTAEEYGYNNNKVEIQYYLGQTLISQAKYKEAEFYLCQALKYSFLKMHIHAALAELYEADGQINKASEAYVEAGIAMLEEANTLNPRSSRSITEEEVANAKTYFDHALRLVPDSIWALTGKGNTLRLLNQLEEAIEVLNQAIELGSDILFTWTSLGLAYEAVGDYQKALEVWKHANTLGPGDIFTILKISQLLRILGRFDDAENMLEKCSELDPWFAQVYIERGILHIEREQFQDALQSFDQALKISPSLIDALIYKGIVLRLMDKLEESIDLLERARRQYPHHSIILGEMGITLYFLGRYEEALTVLELSKLEDQRELTYAVFHSKVLGKLRRFEDAVITIKSVIALEPNSIWAYIELGQLYFDLGKKQDALESVNRALALDPANFEGLLLKLRTLAYLGAFQDALGIFDAQEIRTAVQIANETRLPQVDIDFVNVFLHLWNNEMENALALLEKILAETPEDAISWATKAQTLQAIGCHLEALDALEVAIKYDRRMIWVHMEIGDTLRLTGQYIEAINKLDQVIDHEPDNIYAYRSKCYALLSLNEMEQASETIQKALSINPEDTTLMVDQSLVYQLMDQYQLALEMVNKALAIDDQNNWALTLSAQIACDIGEYRTAVRNLEAIEHPDWENYYNLGWAYENLGPDEAKNALQAYQTALDIEPSYPYIVGPMQGIANTYRLTDDDEFASQTYKDLINIIETSEEDIISADILSILGWCYFQLGEFNEAVRWLTEAQSLYPERISTWFDLALAMICKGRVKLGLSEYEHCITKAKARDSWRQRGLYRVALEDFRLAKKFGWLPIADNPELEDLENELESLFEQVDKAVLATLEPA